MSPTRKKRPLRMREKIIVRIVSKALIPFILLFALYVQFHGDYGPGGGFQAGVIFTAGLVLFALVFGLGALQKLVASRRAIEIAAAAGALLYGGVGIVSMLLGGNFLDYRVLDAHSPIHGQHRGILLIEAGVGITVTATLVSIFYAFAGRDRRRSTKR